MATTLLFRFFGIGKIPKELRAELEAEGLVCLDEGINGRLGFRKFRAPWCYYGRKVSLFSGGLAVTQRRFVATTMMPMFRRIVDIPLDDPRLAKLKCSIDKRNRLVISFEAADFHDDRSGRVEARYAPEHPYRYLDRLKRDCGAGL